MRPSTDQSRAIVSDPATTPAWFEPITGERMRIRVDSRSAGPRMTVVESVAQPGSGPPLHRHPQDELFHLLEGALLFQCGADRFEASAGTIVMVPAGMPHGWFNCGRTPARMMVTFSPGGNEELLTGLGTTPVGQLADYAARYGVDVLGPPIVKDWPSPEHRQAVEESPAIRAFVVSAALLCATLTVLFVQLLMAAPSNGGGAGAGRSFASRQAAEAGLPLS